MNNQVNTNYPWREYEWEEGKTILLDGDSHKPEDACIVDKDNNEVVGCSEWMRGDENFQRIVLCVNACADLTDDQLKEKIKTLFE